jgi:DNA-directed RNA polymerase subunit omega
MTCSSIKRAVQITVTGEEEIVENNGKVVSTALKQILTEKVKYRLVE